MPCRLQPPGGRVALSGVLLALRRHRHPAAGSGDPLVGVLAERGGVHIGDVGGHEPVVPHQADAVVARRAPDPGVGGDRHAELTGGLERGLLRERRVARDVERQLEAQHVVPRGEVTVHEPAHLRGRRPLPRRAQEVAVGEDEAARHGPQCLDGRVPVFGSAQSVRPVHRRGHARVERLDGRQQIARVDVLGAEDLAPVQVVEDEVLGQRPVRAEPAQRRLPHVPVCVDHARHQDAAGGVHHDRVLGCRQRVPDPLDALPAHQDVSALQQADRGIHGQHGGVAEEKGASGGEVVGVRGVDRHEVTSLWCCARVRSTRDRRTRGTAAVADPTASAAVPHPGPWSVSRPTAWSRDHAPGPV